MKETKFYYLFIIFFVFSCNNEPVDTSIFVEEIEEDQDDEEE